MCENMNKDEVVLKALIAFTLVWFLFTLPGCRNLYEGFKAAQAEDCYRLSYPEQDECLRLGNVSYEEYEKRREDARRRQ